MARYMESGRPGFLLVIRMVKELVNGEIEPYLACRLRTPLPAAWEAWNSTRSLRGDMYVGGSQIARKVTYSIAESIEYTGIKLLFAFVTGEYISESSSLLLLPSSWSWCSSSIGPVLSCGSNVSGLLDSHPPQHLHASNPLHRVTGRMIEVLEFATRHLSRGSTEVSCVWSTSFCAVSKSAKSCLST